MSNNLQMMPPRVDFAIPVKLGDGTTVYRVTPEWWKFLWTWFTRSGGDSTLSYDELLVLIDLINQKASRRGRDGEDGRDSRIPGPSGTDGAPGVMGPPGRRGEDGRSRYILINP